MGAGRTPAPRITQLMTAKTRMSYRCLVLFALVAGGAGFGHADQPSSTFSDGSAGAAKSRPPFPFAGAPSPGVARGARHTPSVARHAAVYVAEAAEEAEPLALPPRRQPQQDAETIAPPSPGRAVTTAVGSLGIVLVVFFVFVWVTRRATPKGRTTLPEEVVESLGRAPLVGRQQMQLVRVGKKLVLLSVTSGEARPLTEITDPDEVDRLAGLCQQGRPGSVTATFRNVLAQCATEPTEPIAVTSQAALPSAQAGRVLLPRGLRGEGNG